jgi:hypothetical protein
MKRLRRFTTILLGFLGVSLIVIGFLSKDSNLFGARINSEILSVLGATLFGASFLSIVDLFMGNDIDDIRQYLFRKEKFESATDHFGIIEGRWYVYYLTKKAGRIVWRLAINDFQVDPSHNTISGVATVQASERDSTPERKYLIEAGLRGETMIVVNKAPAGSESDAVEMIFGVARTYSTSFIGVQILETWDGDNALTYSIYSRTPLVDVIDADGAAEVLFETLDRLKQTNRIVDIGVEITKQRSAAAGA